MKKIITLCFALSLFTTTNAQWFGNKKITGNGNVVKTDRKTKDYDEIGVSGIFDVVLVPGTEGNLIIEAEENLIPYIETEIKGNTLKIKTTKGVSLRPKRDIRITVPFEALSAVSLAGSGNISSNAAIKASTFKTNLAGSGDISLEVEAPNVQSNIAGSGDIILKGTADNYKANVAGSGDIKADELITGKTEVSVSGSGDIRVYCNEKIIAKIIGSGNVLYKGNAKEDSKILGSGEIRKER
ncbi:head GIN domain-containing protein [Sinomicrobium sp.]